MHVTSNQSQRQLESAQSLLIVKDGMIQPKVKGGLSLAKVKGGVSRPRVKGGVRRPEVKDRESLTWTQSQSK